MAEPSQYNKNQNAASSDQIVADYVNGLSKERRMLVVLKSQLYEGRWESMLEDLQNRLVGTPYIFKLIGRIKDDIERIKQMEEFEKRHNIDLAEYIDQVD